MRLGIISYSTNTGLGYQTFELFKNLSPYKTLVIDISAFNGMPTYHERFTGNVRITKGLPSRDDINWLLQATEVVFICESPLNYWMYEEAKRRGIPTIQQYNYEFFDYVRNPDLAKPTLLASPTSWYRQEVIDMNIAPVRMLIVPVNREKVKFREIKECKTFLHIVGRITYKDRNGTRAFIEASKRLPEFKYVLAIQKPTEAKNLKEYEEIKSLCAGRIRIVEDLENYEDLYLQGDILVLPRKYGGLCLPMNEALSAGLPVIMPDVSPNADLLPKEWLCTARATESFYFHAPVQLYEPNIESLVEVMRAVSGNMELNNRRANEIAETISWETMKPIYTKAIEEVNAYFRNR